MINSKKDGIDNINIYSKGLTELGRFLSNFSYSPITTVDGSFNAIEGYWYWLSNRQEEMRRLYGFYAKQVGKSFPRTHTLDEDVFKSKIQQACWIKIHSNQTMFNHFKNSSLPFTHYYSYGNKVVDAGFKWLVEMWEYYRTYIQNKE